ncbi:MAG TPA: VTT domain-containing protein [Candidatus Limnocylindria bacterium]|nr:VTT domain-containing protein [Candidatus Limnocylindria bacterium]
MTELFRIFREGIAAVLAIVAQHEYLALFGIVAIEEAGVPLPAPSDLVIMFYGDRARGDLGSLALVILTCAAASTFGTLIPYLVTRKYGDQAAHRIAGWIDVDPKKVDEWEERIARRGFIAIFLGRLIPGLRVAMSLIGGTAKVPLHEFSAGVFGAGLIYWTFWTGLGALFGPTVRRLIPRAYIEYVVIGIPVVFIGFFIYRYVRGRRRRARLGSAG